MEPQQIRDYSIHIEDMCLQVLLNARDGAHEQYEQSALWDNASIILHTHLFSELFICDRGSVEIKTADGITVLFPGDIMVVPAGTAHVKLPSPPDTRWKSVCFSCVKRQVRGCEKFFRKFQPLLEGDHPLILRSHPGLNLRVSCLMQSIAEERTGLFPLELVNLLAYIIDGERGDTPHAAGNSTYYPDIGRMSRLENLVATQFTSDLKTKDAAEQFYLSTRQLDRICRKRYGTTFRQAIINRRLQVAEEMIGTTQMTIEQIGKAVGFRSRVSFFRAFSSAYGVSPNEYRKQHTSKKENEK